MHQHTHTHVCTHMRSSAKASRLPHGTYGTGTSSSRFTLFLAASGLPDSLFSAPAPVCEASRLASSTQEFVRFDSYAARNIQQERRISHNAWNCRREGLSPVKGLAGGSGPDHTDKIRTRFSAVDLHIWCHPYTHSIVLAGRLNTHTHTVVLAGMLTHTHWHTNVTEQPLSLHTG